LYFHSYLCSHNSGFDLSKNPITEKYRQHPVLKDITEGLEQRGHIVLQGLTGSSRAVLSAVAASLTGGHHLFICAGKEAAAYFYNDLENLLGERDLDYHKKTVLFYPTSYKRPYEPEKPDSTYLLSRTEVLGRVSVSERKTIIVTYPEALSEKVVTRKVLSKNTLKIKAKEKVSFDFVTDVLHEYDFERVDFVVEPGQFSVRGGIIDVFSFSNDHPYRMEFFGDEIDSIRTFDPATQLSVSQVNSIALVPNVQSRLMLEERETLPEYLPSRTIVWIEESDQLAYRFEDEYAKAVQAFEKLEDGGPAQKPGLIFSRATTLLNQLNGMTTVEFGVKSVFGGAALFALHTSPQPAFSKNFELLINDLISKKNDNYHCLILSDNPMQIERLYAIFEDIQASWPESGKVAIEPVYHSLQAGFIDHDLRLAVYTDHQVFERYHKFHLRESFKGKEAITLKELYDLKPGDFVSHIDHGIGRFAGLEIIDNNGKKQEAIRLIYKNDDILYVSIHSLHRIAKYTGRDGAEPQLSKLGSNAWNKLKNNTKNKVKDIARDLIKLYAQRKASKGYAFMPDTYLQNELEASFIYEDTPDQLKATIDVKADMESESPMDRLICGDVGFGKTEIAIRAAFKAVTDSKQVAVLVPTTILALQHYKTFTDRLSELPVKVDYINRFKSTKQQKETLDQLAQGKIDILIGTHRLISKDVVFKDLGLMIIDEEQKFGVAAKEKLKHMRASVDSLTLTATPIPRTLQFSMMGARDMSIINTPPPNRYPVHTEIRSFGEEVIREAIQYEVARGGQVFFIHNRVQNILDVYDMLNKFTKGIRIAVAHGQMEGHRLEEIMLGFIDGEYDVLLSTTIVESGLDIPNANTIIINDAQNFGLSDLHQLRGRVGRSNKKAFCYLLAPPLASLTADAQKRLRALQEFADLGSGFSISLRDLDIRGAGNLLGAEQSGFISDIGFEMFHKILDEAIQELKDTEFADVFKSDKPKPFVAECAIESDMEILFPSEYIDSGTERISLYTELDMIADEDNLMKFTDKLIDRFGPLPRQALDLLNTVRMRWVARELGFEKIIIRNKTLIGYFVSDPESGFYQTARFGNLIRHLQSNPRSFRLKESNSKLLLYIQAVPTVNAALNSLRELLEATI
jgi:transcription-repair coupling factor (superfamily II helicase)